MSGAPDDEQLLYARVLAVGMYAGLATLIVTFALYASGIVSPSVPIERLPDYWQLSAHDYLRAINANHLHRPGELTGWWWLTALGSGDYLNYVGIALLSAVTIVCFIAITPVFLVKRDYVYAAIAMLEVMVLVFAASGLLGAGEA